MTNTKTRLLIVRIMVYHFGVTLIFKVNNHLLAFDKTHLYLILKELNAVKDEVLVHKSKPPFRIDVYGSDSFAASRNFMLCRGFKGEWN